MSYNVNHDHKPSSICHKNHTHPHLLHNHGTLASNEHHKSNNLKVKEFYLESSSKPSLSTIKATNTNISSQAYTLIHKDYTKYLRLLSNSNFQSCRLQSLRNLCLICLNALISILDQPKTLTSSFATIF